MREPDLCLVHPACYDEAFACRKHYEAALSDAERYRWIHDNIDWVDGVGYVLNTLHPDADCCAMFQWGVDTTMSQP